MKHQESISYTCISHCSNVLRFIFAIRELFCDLCFFAAVVVAVAVHREKSLAQVGTASLAPVGSLEAELFDYRASKLQCIYYLLHRKYGFSKAALRGTFGMSAPCGRPALREIGTTNTPLIRP
jgi:hypothetical protein